MNLLPVIFCFKDMFQYIVNKEEEDGLNQSGKELGMFQSEVKEGKYISRVLMMTWMFLIGITVIVISHKGVGCYDSANTER